MITEDQSEVVAFLESPSPAIASLHQVAERRFDQGGQAGMTWIVDGNAAGLHEHGTDILDPMVCETVSSCDGGPLRAPTGPTP